MKAIKIPLAIALLGISSLVDAQSVSKRYTPTQLKEDYQKFCFIFEKVHTGLYDYLSEDRWRKIKDSTMQLLNNPMNERDFFRLIAFQVASIRNIHTRHGVTNKWIDSKSDIFPFFLRYFGDRLFVTESLLEESKLPKGTEILSVNGNLPINIRNEIFKFIPADGYNETAKQASLNESFSWYYYLFVDPAKEFEIRYKSVDGRIAQLKTAGLKKSYRQLGFSMREKSKVTPIEFTIHSNINAAYFRIDDSRLFKDSLHLYFERLQKQNIKTLIIDLRGSGGIRDEEQTVQLLSYLIDKPFTFCDYVEIKNNDAAVFDDDFTTKPYTDKVEEMRDHFAKNLKDSGKGYYLYTNEPFFGIQQPASINYSGKIYILTDGKNHSASTDFTSIASTLPNVSIIGEETGGNYRSYVSGAMFGLVLPHTRIGAKVATWKSTLLIDEIPEQKGRGVFPDFPVSQTFDDFLTGRDTVKEFVFDLVAKEN
jgi:hypothetical protein